MILKIDALNSYEAYLQQKLRLDPPEDVLSQLKQTLADKEKENILIKKQLESISMYSEMLEIDLMHKEAYPWDESALSKVTEEDRSILKRYERAIVLRSLNLVTEIKFNEFTKISGLFDALCNYNNKLHPEPVHYYKNRRIELEICGSCGMAVYNGYCKCSN